MPASLRLKSNIMGSAKCDSSQHEARKDKRVHFADALGLSLVSVCIYHPPTRSPYSRKIAIKPSYFERERIDRGRLLNFIQPLCGKKLLETLDRQAICLENITIRDYSISGNIKVKNLTYEKCIFVRYSLDNWNSFQETPAKFVYGSSTGSTDTFKFELVMPETVAKDIKVEFAICYQVLATQIWDNNFGDNYRMMWYGSRQFFRTRDLLDIFQSSRFAGFWI